MLKKIGKPCFTKHITKSAFYSTYLFTVGALLRHGS